MCDLDNSVSKRFRAKGDETNETRNSSKLPKSGISGYKHRFQVLNGSTKGSAETIEWEDGNTYPLLKVEISADSHPFYTGKQKLTMLVDVLISSRRNTT